MERPIRVAIKYPTRISVEHTPDYATFAQNASLHFDGTDGSRLTVILSEDQVSALMGIRSTDPSKMARDLYIRGHIDVEEFERRLDNARE